MQRESSSPEGNNGNENTNNYNHESKEENNNNNNMQKNCQDINDDDCGLETFQRARFCDGQPLFADDLNSMVKNVDNHRLLINRQIIGPGIVCGLDISEPDVTDPKCWIFGIKKGMALDCCGKEIIVSTDIKHKVELPKGLKQDRNKPLIRMGLFIKRNEILKTPVNSIVSDCSCGEPSNCDTRIEESYKLFLQPLTKKLLKIEFDKNVYCINETAKVELWNPDNIPLGSMKVYVTSNRQSSENPQGFDLELIKMGNSNPSFYRGEILLATTKEEINKSVLLVSDNDKIEVTVRIDDNTITSSQSYVNGSQSFIINEKKLLDNYYQDKLSNCPFCEDQDLVTESKENNHGILLSILNIQYTKSEGERTFRPIVKIDNEATILFRKLVYNNEMLYYFLNKNIPECEKPPVVLNDIAFISGTIEQKIPSVFKRHLRGEKKGFYILTDKIKFLQNTTKKVELEFPPLIYLGRINDDPRIVDKERVIYNEDLYHFTLTNEKVLIYSDNTYFPLEPIGEGDNFERELITKKGYIFKPVNIDAPDKSFQILIARNFEGTDQFEPGENFRDTREKVILRWWAICKIKKTSE